MFIDLRCITELSAEVRLGCLSVTPLLLSASASWLLDKVEGLGLWEEVKLLSESCFASLLREGKVWDE